MPSIGRGSRIGELWLGWERGLELSDEEERRRRGSALRTVGIETYGLGGRRLGRGPVTEKRGCAKKKVVTPLLAWHVQDEE